MQLEHPTADQITTPDHAAELRSLARICHSRSLFACAAQAETAATAYESQAAKIAELERLAQIRKDDLELTAADRDSCRARIAELERLRAPNEPEGVQMLVDGLSLIAKGPPSGLSNGEVASWAAWLAHQALDAHKRHSSETRAHHVTVGETANMGGLHVTETKDGPRHIRFSGICYPDCPACADSLEQLNTTGSRES